ncbi:MAG: hypothetical protein KDI14_14630 [Halioglobus sp.]|nr:hypothetical protein [Halioglobus sp.]
MSDTNRNPEAGAAAIWDWKTSQVERLDSGAGALRLKGLVQGGVAVLVALAAWYFGFTLIIYVAGFIGTVVILAALFSPTGFFLTLDRGAVKLGAVLGGTIRWIFIPLVYYLFFVPFGKLFRQGDKDTLKRAYSPAAPSYWVQRDPAGISKGSRRKQF